MVSKLSLSFSHSGDYSLWLRGPIDGSHSSWNDIRRSSWLEITHSFDWLPAGSIGWVIYERIGPVIFGDRVFIDPYELDMIV
jgi:hypothetical protein